MNKTASQIVDTVLEKLATSRWREALRSGEVLGDEAERLKHRMGVDPVREAAGLDRGTKNILERQGYELKNMSATDTAKRMWARRKDLPLGVNLKSEYNTAAGSILGGGGATIPDAFEVAVQPQVLRRKMKTLGGDAAKGMKPTDWKQLQSLLTRHEGDEVLQASKVRPGDPGYRLLNPDQQFQSKLLNKGPSARLGLLATGGNPADNLSANAAADSVIATTPGSQSGMHRSPEVILNERRNQRMLSPATQDLMSRVRDTTGENVHMRKAIQDAGLPEGRIPKGQLRSLSDNMSGIAESEISSFRDKFRSRIQRNLPGEETVRGILSKAKRFL